MKKLITSLFCATVMILAGANVQAQTSTDLINTIAGPAEAMQSTSGLSYYSLGEIVAIVIKVALGLLGIIFLVLIVFAGYRWMTAAGNEEAVNKSKKTIQMAIIGLVIVLAAYAITYFVFERLPFSGGGGDGGGGEIGPPPPTWMN